MVLDQGVGFIKVMRPKVFTCMCIDGISLLIRHYQLMVVDMMMVMGVASRGS